MPIRSKFFLQGPAGCGKTTCGLERVGFLIRQEVSPESILIITPQRMLQSPYQNYVDGLNEISGSDVTFATIGGLARRLIDLFWPVAIEAGGFANPNQPPTFLTLETAQYHMSRIVRPHLDDGWFSSVVMDRNRLYSQILDNLNKAAAVGFTHDEIGDRLASAWEGDPAQRRVYADTQACAIEFRQYCLENNLLDFSLQLEVFTKLTQSESELRRYLYGKYQHVIYDNIEEDIPIAHDVLSDWLPALDSALLIFDQDAGYRRFLGADPKSALRLADLCDEVVTFDETYVTTTQLENLAHNLSLALTPDDQATELKMNRPGGGIEIITSRFYPELLDQVAHTIQDLMSSGTPASEIAVLAPYLHDSLRFSIFNRLNSLGIPVRTHRPSRSLKDEPASQSLITLAALTHPQWEIQPAKFDVVQAFMRCIEGLDLVRAHLLTEIVYRPKGSSLGSFEKINPEMQNRITYRVGSQYETLRLWLDEYKQGEPIPLDHFLRKLFGEVLSQQGFKFHLDFDSARVAANLIESSQKFRLALTDAGFLQESIGKEYMTMLQEGVIAAQYITSWKNAEEDSVLIAPAFTFLMNNQPVSVQFWLDIGSNGWYERLFQPLTHPYVLSRDWPSGKTWTDTNEVMANNDSLVRLTTGLIHRCRERIYLCFSDLGESGYEQRGILLRAFNQVLSQ